MARPTPVALPLSFCAAALLTACGAPSASAVRQGFSISETCPLERVHVQEADPSAIDGPPSDNETLAGRPSPEVAADPERLALWKERTEERWAARSDVHVYDIEGCGITTRRVCWRAGTRGRCETVERHNVESEAKTAALLRQIDEQMDRARAEVCGGMFAPVDFCKQTPKQPR
jgi:hypothetical protein